MPKLTPPNQAKLLRQRIRRIRTAIGQTDYLCSGTLHEHLTRCGKAGCRCAQDPTARHGPYYDWGHMQNGKLVRRRLSAEQAALTGLPSRCALRDSRLGRPGALTAELSRTTAR